jgi:hypothetical protein
MRLVSPARRAALVAAAVTAAGTPPSPAPSASASGDPIVTPLAAALVPGPVFVQVVSGAVTLRHRPSSMPPSSSRRGPGPR